MQAGTARNYLLNITLTLADNTVLPLTEEDIWMDSFKINTASSGQSSFDIGSAIIGECQFQLNNVNGAYDDYDFFNATAVVWVGLKGDKTNDVQNYYRMGFYTVDEPTYTDNLVCLTLLDNMWKFDVPASDVNITYDANTKAIDIVHDICTYCGVTLATQTFHGYNFAITEAPEGDMNCRELLQYVAMIGCNFCMMDDQGNLHIKWYNTSATGTNVAQFPRNFSSISGTDEITITGVKFVVNDTVHRIGTTGYVLELENPLVNESNVNGVLNLIWDVLEGFKLRTFNINTLSDLSVEIGDKCSYTDGKGNTYTSYITSNAFGFADHVVECNAITQSRSLTVRYSKEVQAMVEEARKQAREVVSDYDLAVQMMNDLAVNAMGGYQEYEDLVTGGRIYYLSNRPITKDAQTGQCSFEPNSTVFKVSGDGFFVSINGGTTWTNGYNPQTGQLVVNVLNAIGLSAEWVKTGTLDVGGNGTSAVIRVKDSSNNIICTIDNRGIIMSQGALESDDYTYTSGHFSDDGTRFDVTNDYLRSKYFAFDMNGAYINGQVEATTGHIGAATITQDAIKVIGDVELYSGSGTFVFRPADYYFAFNFPLILHTEGSCTVTLTAYVNSSTYPIGTYSVDSTADVTTALIDHTIGLNDGDYYEVAVSGSSCDVSAKDVILAYMGEEGFQGTLRGIFKGYIDSDTGRLGHFSYSRASDYLKSDTDFNISVVDSQDNEGEIRITPTYLRYLNHYGDKIFFEHDNAKNNAKITREVSGRDSHVVWSDDMANEMFGQFVVQGINIRLSQTQTGTINIDFNPLKYDTANDPYAADPTLPLIDGAVVLIYE